MNAGEENPARLQLWGGVECTINRIGDRFYSQLSRRSLQERLEDLDRIAGLRIRTVRFPVLWEEVFPEAAEAGGEGNWSWADAGLEKLRSLKIRPILGLVHHGSGPGYTNLLDPQFGEKLAGYARRVAERYPWVGAYTPVNEPLTTARFSSLYGHWFPHTKSPASFSQALLNQLKATVLAMNAIRQINPGAQLIQTDDLGITLSSPGLAYQAEFENERRWATFDLLTGRLDPKGRIWGYFREAGVSESALEWFGANRSEPGIIGINHYITSNRYLDEELHCHPSWMWGGNGRHRYVDTEVVRSPICTFYEPIRLIREAWERYGIPIAITEAHLGSTREEQMRWFGELWQAATRLREEGIPVLAVTAWSILGAYDWDSLLVRQDGHYEAGIFDLRSPQPRETAMAGVLRKAAESGKFEHPLIQIPGWWRREVRLLNRGSPKEVERVFLPVQTRSAPVLITGATGTLGQAFARICTLRGIPYRLLSRTEMDIAHENSVRQAIEAFRPWGVINAAGYVRVDAAERDWARCLRENAQGPRTLAAVCAESKVRLLTFSSDLVFDGSKEGVYLESDAISPLNVYGLSKAEAEWEITRCNPDALIIRTSSFFGPWDSHNFLVHTLRTLRQQSPVTVAEDTRMSPTYVPELVNYALDLYIDAESGIWHLANVGSTSWADFATAAAGHARLDTSLIQRCATRDLGLPARRPLNSALGSERGVLLQAWENALERYFFELHP